MGPAEKRSFNLTSEQANYIDGLIASGAYASGSDVIHAGFLALQERDVAVERWLEAEVVPVVVRMRADPHRAISADGVFDGIRALHANRVSRDA